jgi:hypothetical protein
MEKIQHIGVNVLTNAIYIKILILYIKKELSNLEF